jgi:hypothetical protein
VVIVLRAVEGGNAHRFDDVKVADNPLEQPEPLWQVGGGQKFRILKQRTKPLQ